METVCAISTPLAVGGISVIRISGEKAIEIAASVFQPISCESVERMQGYTCCYGKIISDGEVLDDGILTVFRAPKSYTGEDVAEISCHGGIYITKQVLAVIVKKGASPALGGEFTKRAFLNGKLSLTQAEAVMDLISAQGEQSRRSAVSVRDGELFRRISDVSARLVHVLGGLAAWVDYPDEDIPDVDEVTLKSQISASIHELSALLNGYEKGRIFRDGIDTAIVGKPNVGKSTLMNLLLGFERSIVTDIAGTTRDIVEESVRLGEIILRLSDTAGIRSTEDIVESLGVSLAYKKLEQAQLVIAVFDNSVPLGGDDIKLLEMLDSKNTIIVINKSDLEQKLDRGEVFNSFEKIVEISAKNNDGTSALENQIKDMFRLNEVDNSAGIISTERQRLCLLNSLSYLEAALSALNNGETLDAVNVLIDQAASSLLELTGEKVSEAVVNDVFSRFCVGK